MYLENHFAGWMVAWLAGRSFVNLKAACLPACCSQLETGIGSGFSARVGGGGDRLPHTRNTVFRFESCKYFWDFCENQQFN